MAQSQYLEFQGKMRWSRYQCLVCTCTWLLHSHLPRRTTPKRENKPELAGVEAPNSDIPMSCKFSSYDISSQVHCNTQYFPSTHKLAMLYPNNIEKLLMLLMTMKKKWSEKFNATEKSKSILTFPFKLRSIQPLCCLCMASLNSATSFFPSLRPPACLWQHFTNCALRAKCNWAERYLGCKN